MGVYRLWRDAGYAVGALLAGGLADRFGLDWAIYAVAGLTFLSGGDDAAVMYETRSGWQPAAPAAEQAAPA